MVEKGNPDLGTMCRLCLTSGVPLINIFPIDRSDGGQQLSIPMRIMTCAALEVTPCDGLPKSICADCRFQLEKSYYFRKRSQASDSKLRKHIRLLNLGKKSNVFCNPSEEDLENELEFEDSKQFIQIIEEKKEQEKKDAWHEKLINFKKDYKHKLRAELIEELQESLREESVKQAKLELRKELEEECRAQERKKLLDELQHFLIEKNGKDLKSEHSPPLLHEVNITIQNQSKKSDVNQLFDDFSDTEQHYSEITAKSDRSSSDHGAKSDGSMKDGYFILNSEDHHNDNDSEFMEMETEVADELLRSDVEEDRILCSPSKTEDNKPTLYQIAEDEEIRFHKKDDYVNMNTEMGGVVVFNIEEAMEDGNAMVEIVNYNKNYDLLKRSAADTQEENTEEGHIKESFVAESNSATVLPIVMTGRTTDTPKTFKCSDCPITFSTYNSLLRHMRTHAKMEKKGISYQCPDCKIFVSCNSALKRHMLIHTGQRPFPCTICNKSFVQREILKRHLITHSGERPYKCTQCDRSFTQKSNLAQHINTNHTDKPKIQQHKCHLCPKRFNHHSGLSRHLATHSGVAFQCIECNRTFNDRSSVKRHVVHVHGIGGSMQKTKSNVNAPPVELATDND